MALVCNTPPQAGWEFYSTRVLYPYSAISLAITIRHVHDTIKTLWEKGLSCPCARLACVASSTCIIVIAHALICVFGSGLILRLAPRRPFMMSFRPLYSLFPVLIPTLENMCFRVVALLKLFEIMFRSLSLTEISSSFAISLTEVSSSLYISLSFLTRFELGLLAGKFSLELRARLTCR